MLTTVRTLTEFDIQPQFNDAELAQLRRLRNGYHPVREFCESDLEFHRLAFVKWRAWHETELARDTALALWGQA